VPRPIPAVVRAPFDNEYQRRAHNTWEQLDVVDNRAGNALRYLGIGPASRVALLGKNFSRWFEMLFGTHKVCAVILVNWRLAALEIRRPLKDSES
jgi:hypothetical protein